MNPVLKPLGCIVIQYDKTSLTIKADEARQHFFFFQTGWGMDTIQRTHTALGNRFCVQRTNVSELRIWEKSALKAAKSSGFHSMGIARKQLRANSLFCKQDCRGDQCKKTNLKCTVTVELTVNISLLCALINTKTEDLCTNTPCTQFLLSFYSSVCEALTNNWRCVNGQLSCKIFYVNAKSSTRSSNRKNVCKGSQRLHCRFSLAHPPTPSSPPNAKQHAECWTFSESEVCIRYGVKRTTTHTKKKQKKQQQQQQK